MQRGGALVGVGDTFGSIFSRVGEASISLYFDGLDYLSEE